MKSAKNLIFLHGLEGSSQGNKARYLRGLLPKILVPYFCGSLAQRMSQLEAILAGQPCWAIIGSSFGGLMAAIYASQHPKKVQKLILLAPALIWPEFAKLPLEPIQAPTVIVHGENDAVVPLAIIRRIAERAFLRLEFHAVDDDHSLLKTTFSLDWRHLVEE